MLENSRLSTTACGGRLRYIPHVVDRKQEALCKQRDPKKQARRWIVEACHGWFNRFRKLLVRYEKLEHTFGTHRTHP